MSVVLVRGCATPDRHFDTVAALVDELPALAPIGVVTVYHAVLGREARPRGPCLALYAGADIQAPLIGYVFIPTPVTGPSDWAQLHAAIETQATPETVH